MPRIKSRGCLKSEKYRELSKQSEANKEGDDCSVITVAVACNVPYEKAHEALKYCGRENCCGTTPPTTRAAINKLGYKCVDVSMKDIIEKYPSAHHVLKSVTTHHPERFPKVWKDGNVYIFWCSRHVCAVVDGVVHDWTKGRAKRCHKISKVVRKDGNKI